MNKTINEKLKLGVFVIIGSLLFIVAVYLIGNRQNMFTKTFSISANFNNISGLILGNNVRYSGINVGTVKSIEMINDSVIKVDMKIEEKMVKHIKKDAIAASFFMWRVNGPLMNTPAFYGAYNIQPGEKMYLPEDERIKIW